MYSSINPSPSPWMKFTMALMHCKVERTNLNVGKVFTKTIDKTRRVFKKD